MDGLEHCPFCGGKDIRRQSRILGAGYSHSPQIGPRLATHWIRCAVCSADGPEAEDLTQAVANWNRRPTSTLTGVITMDQAAVGVSSGTGMALPSSGSNAKIDWPQPTVSLASLAGSDPRSTMIDRTKLVGVRTVFADQPDDLSQAREKRDLAGLPSLSTTAEPDGLSMDFDLGGGKPRKR
jgi:Lar family restriction alleviation protein